MPSNQSVKPEMPCGANRHESFPPSPLEIRVSVNPFVNLWWKGEGSAEELVSYLWSLWQHGWIPTECL